jgi:hypothetical protein
MRQALAIDKTSFGPEDPEISTDLNDCRYAAGSHQPVRGSRTADPAGGGHCREVHCDDRASASGFTQLPKQLRRPAEFDGRPPEETMERLRGALREGGMDV